MKVIVAETAGFCNGVKNALEVTLEAIQKRKNGETICTFGPLIHNRHVLGMLEKKGVYEESEIENCSGKQVVIRAHGIPPEQRRALHLAGAAILDATCKRVAKVQAVIKRYALRGYHTVIVGDADHAEVIGLMGYASGLGVVINQPGQIDNLPADWEKTHLVAQTTQNEEVFKEIEKRFLERHPHGIVNNTICGSTHERQSEVRELCHQVEAMIIVGGRHSGNTIRLAEIARECGIPSYHIETEADLEAKEMSGYASVGVSAGASTPNWMIRNVVRFLEAIETVHSNGRSSFKRILDLLAYTNIYVASGAALLGWAVAAMAGLTGSLSKSAMAASYVFGMHTINRYLDHHAIQFNDPARAAFYQRWNVLFIAVSILAVTAALWIAHTLSNMVFLSMLVVVLLGILYGVPLVRATWKQGLSSLKIKDIPASKTFLIPIAWAGVTTILPHAPSLAQSTGAILFAFWVVFLLVLVRTSLLDLLDVQGDYLVGKETIVVLLGETRSVHFIRIVLFVLILSLLLGPLCGVSSRFAYVALPFVSAYAWCLTICRKNLLKGGILTETVTESIPIAIGALGIAWVLLRG
jgi:4-hydroxy-3-methylbut-2-enyl diphosphate reductase